MAQGKDIIPVIGARRRAQLGESLGALAVALSPADIAEIEQAMPKGAAAGERYAPHGMATLDSEQPLA
jgi:aryl-alcohol dehydrogenase-like predicted oxidoreductase